jgi:hypothetical protein
MKANAVQSFLRHRPTHSVCAFWRIHGVLCLQRKQQWCRNHMVIAKFLERRARIGKKAKDKRLKKQQNNTVVLFFVVAFVYLLLCNSLC